MFDLSWAEISIVALVGLLVLGPKEFAAIVRNCRKIIGKIKNIGQEFTDAITDMDEVKDLKKEAGKVNEDINMIVDLEGKLQKTYDISDFIRDEEK